MNARERNLRVVRSTDDVRPDLGVVHNVPGNHYDKHGSSNPVVKWLMARFHSSLTDLARTVPHTSILDVGCGEGRTTRVLGEALAPKRLIGCELELEAVSEGPDNAPGALFLSGSVYELPFESHAFDLVVATEVLEHLDDPASALEELSRVGRSAILVTVPNEPWWRIGNMARGAYLRDWGNTPGHVQHWTTRAFRTLLESKFEESHVRTTAMWNLGLIRLANQN